MWHNAVMSEWSDAIGGFCLEAWWVLLEVGGSSVELKFKARQMKNCSTAAEFVSLTTMNIQ